jgi:MFS family permease
MRSRAHTGEAQVNLSIVTAVVCVALGAVSAAMASLNVAIPDLVRSTHASSTQLEWIIDAYLLVFSVLLLPAGALGDRYGRRRALIAGLIIFGTASAMAMAASSASELIFLRGLIGLGAALVMPATLSTITGTFPPAERTQAVGVWAAVAGGSAILGLLCSGILLQWFSWQAAFAVNVVLATVALAGTIRFVPESSQPDAPVLDKGGALLATVGLVALVFSIIEAPDAGWLGTRTLGGVAIGLLALTGFVLFERRQRDPLLDPRLFANRKLSASSLSISIQFFAFFGFTFVSLQYLEGVRGYSALVAALAILPLSAAMMPTAKLTPRLVSRYGARTICVTGLSLVAVGLVIVSRIGTTTPYWLFLAGIVPLGVGHGSRHDARHRGDHRGPPPGTTGCGLGPQRPVARGRRSARHRGHRQHRDWRLPVQPPTPGSARSTAPPGPSLVCRRHPRRWIDGRARPRRLRQRHPHRAALRGGRGDHRRGERRHPAPRHRGGPPTRQRG